MSRIDEIPCARTLWHIHLLLPASLLIISLYLFFLTLAPPLLSFLRCGAGTGLSLRISTSAGVRYGCTRTAVPTFCRERVHRVQVCASLTTTTKTIKNVAVKLFMSLIPGFLLFQLHPVLHAAPCNAPTWYCTHGCFFMALPFV